MTIDTYLIRPDKTTGTVDLTKEAIAETSGSFNAVNLSDVECLKIQANTLKHAIQIDNNIKKGANQRSSTHPLSKFYHIYQIGDWLLGNYSDSASQKYASRLMQIIEYIGLIWPRAYSTKGAILAGHDGTNFLDVYKYYDRASSTWTDFRGVIDGNITFQTDFQYNVTLHQIQLTQVTN